MIRRIIREGDEGKEEEEEGEGKRKRTRSKAYLLSLVPFLQQQYCYERHFCRRPHHLVLLLGAIHQHGHQRFSNFAWNLHALFCRQILRCILAGSAHSLFHLITVVVDELKR